MGEHIKFIEKPQRPVKGSVGLESHLPGCATTVGNLGSIEGMVVRDRG